jgi:hypothetical protein
LALRASSIARCSASALAFASASARARLRFRLRLGARRLVRLGRLAPLLLGRLLLAHELAHVVRRRGHDALRRRGRLARRGEIELVLGRFAGERIGLFLARLEDPRIAVLQQLVDRDLGRPLVHLDLLHDLAEVGLAVDHLEDLHEVLRERRRFLVDLRNTLRGLGENRASFHPGGPGVRVGFGGAPIMA